MTLITAVNCVLVIALTFVPHQQRRCANAEELERSVRPRVRVKRLHAGSTTNGR